MNALFTMPIAYRALAKNKLRAGLTILGIVIGVAAVISLVSIGQGASAMVQDQFSSLGTNLIVVIPGSIGAGGVRRGAGTVMTMTAADATAMVDECPAVLAASPIVIARGQVIYGNSNWAPDDIVGADTGFLTVRNWEMRSGGFFTDSDIRGAAKVCVIGQTLVAHLFQTINPIGKTVRIKNIPFVIIGVLEAKGAGILGQDQDNVVVAPYTTIKKRLSGSAFNNVDQILVSARSLSRMSDAEDEISWLLRERHRVHPGSPDDFTVRNTAEIAKIFGVVTGIMTSLLASIASVSLLVGGVGIMNIMLVSVTERTREIGIRLAVGARGWDILQQFLVESMLLSALGGLLGVGLGIGASYCFTAVFNAMTSGTKWPLVISLPAAVLALAFSASVGLAFGFYPALKASRLDPIESLRYE